MIKDIDIGYVAGIIDGEGHIRSSSGGLPKIAVKMTDLDVLDRCQFITELGKINGPRIEGPNRKPIWNWVVQDQRGASSLLMTIFPLVSRRRQAKIIEVLISWKKKPLPYSAPCGTQAGYYKHYRHGEESCLDCHQARLEYDRNKRNSRKGE